MACEGAAWIWRAKGRTSRGLPLQRTSARMVTSSRSPVMVGALKAMGSRACSAGAMVAWSCPCARVLPFWSVAVQVRVKACRVRVSLRMMTVLSMSSPG